MSIRLVAYRNWKQNVVRAIVYQPTDVYQVGGERNEAVQFHNRILILFFSQILIKSTLAYKSAIDSGKV